MARRRSRGRRKKSNGRRGLGCLVVILLMLCSLFLVTCRKQQGNNSGAPGQPPTSQSHSRSVDDHTEQRTATSTPSPRYNDTASREAADVPAPVSTAIHDNTDALSDDQEFSRGDVTQKRIAITFDAGAGAKPTEQILDVLAKHNVKCTFFLTGKWMEQNRLMTRRIADAGHEIGNHSNSHKRFTDLTDSEIADDVDKTDRLAIDITAQSTKPLFRCPFGSRDKRVLKALADLGYKSVYWDVDSWDSVKKDITSDQIEERVLENVRNGSIILMHCGSQPTADALSPLLMKLESAGYKPVTVRQLAGL